MKKAKNDTSWGAVADWYDDYLEENQDTYQRQVILPNLLRLVVPKAGDKILDLACGSGFFARELAAAARPNDGSVGRGAQVIGVDVAPELINLAKKQEVKNKNIDYFISPAHELSMIPSQSIDTVVNILAIQNIAEVKPVLAEVKRVLKSSGRFVLILNHPAIRNPRASSWGWDEKNKSQYRRLDQYLSESKVEIEMNPGADPQSTTISFHRPLQYYFKLLGNAGFAVSRLEEWISHKESQAGPRQTAEDRARHEFPLFLFLEARKI